MPPITVITITGTNYVWFTTNKGHLILIFYSYFFYVRMHAAKLI